MTGSVNANEKMPNLQKSFDRNFVLTKADTAARVCMRSCVIGDEASLSLRVARLMREAGVCAKRKRRRVLTTHRDPSHPVASNLLNREFTAEKRSFSPVSAKIGSGNLSCEMSSPRCPVVPKMSGFCFQDVLFVLVKKPIHRVCLDGSWKAQR
jgi:hypothetical protein